VRNTALRLFGDRMARGSVVKKGSRFYCVSPYQGKQVWRAGGETIGEAQARLSKYMQEDHPNDNLLFKQFAQDFLFQSEF